jgi:hypothetical protein
LSQQLHRGVEMEFEQVANRREAGRTQLEHPSRRPVRGRDGALSAA